jgi:predicted transcriptional regulator
VEALADTAWIVFKGRLPFWGFKRAAELTPMLGPLEHRVMETVWRRGECSVKDVYAGFEASTAYTTVMTTMDRLYKKGLLARRKQGRAYFYSATASRDELDSSVASGFLEVLLGQRGDAAQPVLSRLVDVVGESDRALLDELDRLVKEKRRRLKKGQPS